MRATVCSNELSVFPLLARNTDSGPDNRAAVSNFHPVCSKHPLLSCGPFAAHWLKVPAVEKSRNKPTVPLPPSTVLDAPEVILVGKLHRDSDPAQDQAVVLYVLTAAGFCSGSWLDRIQE